MTISVVFEVTCPCWYCLNGCENLKYQGFGALQGVRPYGNQIRPEVPSSHNETKSVIFQNWIRGQKRFSKASEILASLGLEPESKAADKDEAARKLDNRDCK